MVPERGEGLGFKFGSSVVILVKVKFYRAGRKLFSFYYYYYYYYYFYIYKISNYDKVIDNYNQIILLLGF
jgi:hypothetical protein